MRVLVTWGSKRGGTAGIGERIAEALHARGHVVIACAAEHAPPPDTFDAVVLGGALYANRWHRAARRYANRHAAALRQLPVWLFSSGPLDASADTGALVPTSQVATIAERIGAREHVTFGGRLAPDAEGWIAAAMAKKTSGDWRDPARIEAWAAAIARDLPFARPGVGAEPPARRGARVVEHAVVGWGACAAVSGIAAAVASPRVAVAVAAAVVPIVFALIANLYFRVRGARDPLPTAAIVTAVVAALDLGAIGLVHRDLARAGSLAGFWLPLALVFATTWVVGAVRSVLPVSGPRVTA